MTILMMKQVYDSFSIDSVYALYRQFPVYTKERNRKVVPDDLRKNMEQD
jgi:hypothetical protein